MAEPSRRQVAACVVGAALVVAVGLAGPGGHDESSAPTTPPAALELRDEERGDRVVVHVAGAVRNPGVYALRADARVETAVARAGGATRRADLSALNLAARMEDGRQVLVPERAPRAGSARAGAPPPSGEGPVNLNTATLEELDLVSGIGPLTAQKILDFREERGGFGSIDELAEIPGIGDKRLATLREELTL